MPLPTLQFELRDWRGLNRYSQEADVEPTYLSDCQNVDFDEAGVISKRRGAKDVGTAFSDTIHMIYDWQSQTGFSLTFAETDVQRTVIVSGSTLYVIQGFNSSNTISASFAATDSYHYAVTDDLGVCFVSNEKGGVPKLLAFVNDGYVYQEMTLYGPTSAATISATDVETGLTGTFGYCYAYVDVWGNESPLSPESAEVYLDDETLDVELLGSTDTTVAYIKAYVLGPGLSEFHFSQTFDNTDQTYTHTMSMAELEAGGFPPTNLQQPAPAGKYLAMYEDMLLVAGDTDVPDTVWCSNRQYHRQWSDSFARCVTGDGQPVRGFGESFDKQLIIKSDSIFICEGDHQDTFLTRKYISKYGALGQPSICYGLDRMTWFSDDGMYIDTGANPDEISKIMRNYLRTLDWRNLATVPPKQVAATYKYYRQCFFAVREYVAEAGENDVILIWSYDRDTWTRYAGNVGRCFGAVQNADDYEYLFGGDADGNVWIYMPPNSSNANDDVIGGTTYTITAYAETPWIHLPRAKGMDDWENRRTVPRYVKVYASGENPGNDNVDLQCTYYVDFDHDTVISTFDLTFPAHDWPTVRPYAKSIWYGGAVGTFNWVKWRFDFTNAGQHLKIHKLVFGFKAKPAID